MSIVLNPITSGSDLVTNARAVQVAALSALNTSNPTLLASLITAASVAIVKECKREFVQQSFTEYLSGGNYPYDTFHLKNFPVVSIGRLGTNPQTVLMIVNGNSTLNQRATIATTATGVTLTTVQSGVVASTSLAYSSYLTVQLLANAIAALGSGWTATVQGPYGNHPSLDLRPLQGAYTALNGGASLQMYTEEMGGATGGQWFGYEDGYGGSSSDGGGDCSGGWRLDDKAGILYGRFPRGRMNIRVDYIAGFAAVPDDVQEACVQMTLDLYNSEGVNQAVKSGSLGPYRFENNTAMGLMSPKVKQICSIYKDRSKLNQTQ